MKMDDTVRLMLMLPDGQSAAIQALADYVSAMDKSWDEMTVKAVENLEEILAGLKQWQELGLQEKLEALDERFTALETQRGFSTLNDAIGPLEAWRAEVEPLRQMVIDLEAWKESVADQLIEIRR